MSDVLARSKRPAHFGEFIGSEDSVRSLIRSLSAPFNENNPFRVSKNVFLFYGVPGVGKTSLARLTAKWWFCESRVSKGCGTCSTCSAGNVTDCSSKVVLPCGECGACAESDKYILTGKADGVLLDITEYDAGYLSSRSDIDSVVADINAVPVYSGYRVVFIDEAHNLTAKARTALLKTVEEASSRVILLFCTSEVSKLPPEFMSRMQVRIHVHALSVKECVSWLAELCSENGVSFDKEGLRDIAGITNGVPRDCLHVVTQVVDSHGAVSVEGVSAVASVVPASVVHELLSAYRDRDMTRYAVAVSNLVSCASEDSVVSRLRQEVRRAVLASAGVVEPSLTSSAVKRYRQLVEGVSVSDMARFVAGIQGLTSGDVALNLLSLGLSRVSSEPVSDGVTNSAVSDSGVAVAVGDGKSFESVQSDVRKEIRTKAIEEQKLTSSRAMEAHAESSEMETSLVNLGAVKLI